MRVTTSVPVTTAFLVSLMAGPEGATAQRFEVTEASIAEIHAAMAAGQLTARELVQMCLDRIEAYDRQGPAINAIISTDDTFVMA